MVTPKLFVFIYCIFQLTFAQETVKMQCEYSYGNWTDCINYSQSRSVMCLCGGVISDLSLCNATLTLTQQPCSCKWRWSKWSRCTADCAGGNTTRIPQCFCNDALTDDSKCDINFYFGRETVSCNEFDCGDIPALNKLYWISQEDTNSWPIENGIFNCSKGFDPKDSPKGLTYYVVLADSDPFVHLHPEWYFLAKEWITAKLNLANGAQFSSDSVQLITQVGEILEQCTGWSDEELPQIYSRKEKLGRLNNNIGGLENVDSQISLMSGGNNQNTEDLSSSLLSLIMAIVIPLAAILIVTIALGFVVYYVRQKTEVAKDQFESENENELLKNTDTIPPNSTDSMVALDTSPEEGDEN